MRWQFGHLLFVLFYAFAGVVLSAEALEDGMQALAVQDYVRARDIFTKLSQQGDARATFYLSLLYRKGLGVEKNLSQSVYLLKQAAEAGDPMAQYNLGNQYNREGVLGFNPGLAAAWWEKAAKQGLVLAQHNLGSMYALGRGVEQNLDKARYWYGQAVANGSKRSAEALKELDRLAVKSPQPGSRQVSPPPEKAGARMTAVDAAWIDTQPRHGYTLQLLASGKREDIVGLASRYQWRRQLLLYPVDSGGATLWALGYGVFSKASDARKANAELPRPLQAGQPWPRSLSDVRKHLPH